MNHDHDIALSSLIGENYSYKGANWICFYAAYSGSAHYKYDSVIIAKKTCIDVLKCLHF
jgi:hypothetical protein